MDTRSYPFQTQNRYAGYSTNSWTRGWNNEYYEVEDRYSQNNVARRRNLYHHPYKRTYLEWNVPNSQYGSSRHVSTGPNSQYYGSSTYKSNTPNSQYYCSSTYKSNRPNSHYYDASTYKTVTITCYTCGQQFPTKKLLWSHKDKAHPKRNFYCEICNEQFSTFSSLKEHGKTHPTYACQECPETFRYENSYLAHIGHAHRTESIAISNIEDKSTNVVNTKEPLGNTLPSSFKTPVASSTPSSSFNKQSPDTTQNSSVDSGIDIKLGKPLRCSRCIKTFDTADSLISHAKIHTIESSLPSDSLNLKVDIQRLQFACPYCIKTFDTRRELQLHMNSAHTVLFYCPKCPSEFSFEAELKAHSKVHN